MSEQPAPDVPKEGDVPAVEAPATPPPPEAVTPPRRARGRGGALALVAALATLIPHHGDTSKNQQNSLRPADTSGVSVEATAQRVEVPVNDEAAMEQALAAAKAALVVGAGASQAEQGAQRGGGEAVAEAPTVDQATDEAPAPASVEPMSQDQGERTPILESELPQVKVGPNEGTAGEATQVNPVDLTRTSASSTSIGADGEQGSTEVTSSLTGTVEDMTMTDVKDMTRRSKEAQDAEDREPVLGPALTPEDHPDYRPPSDATRTGRIPGATTPNPGDINPLAPTAEIVTDDVVVVPPPDVASTAL